MKFCQDSYLAFFGCCRQQIRIRTQPATQKAVTIEMVENRWSSKTRFCNKKLSALELTESDIPFQHRSSSKQFI